MARRSAVIVRGRKSGKTVKPPIGVQIGANMERKEQRKPLMVDKTFPMWKIYINRWSEL